MFVAAPCGRRNHTQGFVGLPYACYYEVVLASGAIVHAYANTHPDLFRALKGGSGSM